MSTEIEFKVGDHTYRAGRLSTFDQMNLAADFRDCLSGLAYLKKGRPAKVTDEQYAKTVEFIVTGGMSGLAAERRQRVINLCLSKVKRRAAGKGIGWSDVVSAEGDLMFQDVGLGPLIAIMYRVFEHNGLLDFFLEGPSASDGPKEEETGSVSQMARTG